MNLRIVRKWMICVVILFASVSKLFSQSNEADVKAMFIFNFIKYVEWPQSKSDAVFRIGVFGKSPVSKSLEKVIAQKNKEGRRIELVDVAESEATDCQMLFISQSVSPKNEVLTKMKQSNGILIISDESSKSEKWAAINLLTIDNKIRFEINLGAAKSGGVKISSQLSNLAVSVNP